VMVSIPTRRHLTVWMRDVLGTTDHLKGLGQDAGIERRIVTGLARAGAALTRSRMTPRVTSP
jgi:hypothetical protein